MVEPTAIELYNSFVFEAIDAAERVGIDSTKAAFTLNDVAEILDKLDYTVSIDFINQWITRGLFPSKNGYSMKDVYALRCGLELRRLWKVTPSSHDAKKSKARLTREGMSVDQANDTFVNSIAAYDNLYLLNMLTESDSKEEREAIYEGLVNRIDPLTGEFVRHEAAMRAHNA